MTVVTNLKEEGRPVGILGDGEVVWHSDFSFKDAPTAARMLLAVEVPPSELGGHTYFMNCYAAYDALPHATKKRIAGLTIKQANIIDTAMKIRPGMSLDMDFRAGWCEGHLTYTIEPTPSGCRLRQRETLALRRRLPIPASWVDAGLRPRLLDRLADLRDVAQSHPV